MTWARGKLTGSRLVLRASAADGSTPWKMPAVARGSSFTAFLQLTGRAVKDLSSTVADHVG
jgi:hypothetical protein